MTVAMAGRLLLYSLIGYKPTEEAASQKALKNQAQGPDFRLGFELVIK